MLETESREGERGGRGQAGVHRALSPSTSDMTPITKLGFRAGIMPALHEGAEAQPCRHLPKVTQGAAVLTPSPRAPAPSRRFSTAPSFSTASNAVIATY